MITESAMQKIVEFIKENPDGVEFDTLDNKFQLLHNHELDYGSEDDFDKMFVGANASIKALCHKRNGRYFVNAE